VFQILWWRKLTLTWLWHFLPATVLGFVAFVWLALAIYAGLGVLKIPSLKDSIPLADTECPTVSILFAARDEEEKLPGALATFLAQDYPRYEVVAVNDRSEDATEAILDAAGREDARLKVIRITSLPAGWLGKPYALQQAYEKSTGEWLVLTDADVHFAPDVLRRAIALVEKNKWDHMPLLADAKMFTFGEKVVMTFVAFAFVLATRPWNVNKPHSPAYIGVGAFQLIRRSTYEKMGTHRRLAMEVIDDVKVGKLVKETGGRSGVAKAGQTVSVYWHSGVRNIIRGTEKNFFATTGFRWWIAGAQLFSIALMWLFPLLAVPFVHGWARGFALAAIAVPMIAQAGAAKEFRVSVFYALTQPVGAAIFFWMLLRSTIITMRNGGIVWRGTFYSTEELKRGIV
jgi:cellulose synthase/poly-beta-1,6-N-acetylglucosamine synthase-like glycosyltransferase